MGISNGYIPPQGGGSGGVSNFLSLSDTPSSFAGEQDKFIKINADATKLEFTTLSGGGDMTKAVYDIDDDGIVDISESVDGGEFS